VKLPLVIDGATSLIPPKADKTVKPNEILFISYNMFGKVNFELIVDSLLLKLIKT